MGKMVEASSILAQAGSLAKNGRPAAGKKRRRPANPARTRFFEKYSPATLKFLRRGTL
jgi:hypothetical protein